MVSKILLFLIGFILFYIIFYLIVFKVYGNVFKEWFILKARGVVIVKGLIYLFIFLVLGSFVYASGCCYVEGGPVCNSYYEDGQAACEAQLGIYNSDPTCGGIPQCETVCCCDGSIPHYTLRGECEVRQLKWIYTTEQGCNLFCDGTPACNDDCQFNSGDCVGRGGLISAAGKYYCWNKDTTYLTQADCLDNCNATSYSISGYMTDANNTPLANIEIELENAVIWHEIFVETNSNGYFEFLNISPGLYDFYINGGDETEPIAGYTSINLDDGNLINLTEDLEINATLLGIDINLELNSSGFKHGGAIEGNVTATNNEVFGLTDWLHGLAAKFGYQFFETGFYFNLTPVNLSAGETKSELHIVKIPDNDTDPELNFYGIIANLNWNLTSSEGLKKASIFAGKRRTIYTYEYDLDGDGIPNFQDPDDDNDGINDTYDNLLGNGSSIKSNLENISIFIDNSTNISQLFNDIHNIQLFSNNESVLEFDYNFSYQLLDLHDVGLYRQDTTDKGSLLVIGISLPGNLTKNAYLDDLNETIGSVCIKDEAILFIDEISGYCNESNEILLDCDGAAYFDYSCTDIGDRYKITGLKHSGIIEFDSLKLFSITLSKGWNLISIPLKLMDNPISLFNEKNLTIFGYKNNSWFVPEHIEAKLGYWVKANGGFNLTLAGNEIEDRNINLSKGWNLIGYPSLNGSLVNETFNNSQISDVMMYNNLKWYSYNPSRPDFLNTLNNMTPGYGYWVNAKENFTLIFSAKS